MVSGWVRRAWRIGLGSSTATILPAALATHLPRCRSVLARTSGGSCYAESFEQRLASRFARKARGHPRMDGTYHPTISRPLAELDQLQALLLRWDHCPLGQSWP